MFKKILKKADEQRQEQLFPNPDRVAKILTNEIEVNSNITENNSSGILKYIMDKLTKDEYFLQILSRQIIPELLDILATKYNFEPTDKYLEEVANKKQYINQLNEYLKERQELNMSVDGELKQFLNTTTTHLAKALEDFTLKINKQIQDAESRYGIEAVRDNLISKVSKD